MTRRVPHLTSSRLLSSALALLILPPGAGFGGESPVDRLHEGGGLGSILRPPLPEQVTGQALNFGVILETYPSPDERPAGLGFDGTHLWLVTETTNTQTIWKLAPADASVVDSFPAQVATEAFGLDHDGGVLWGDSYLPTQLYTADPVDGTLLQSFPSAFERPNGLVWDGADLWQSAFGEDLAVVDVTDGSIIRTVPAPGDLGAPRDMAWDGTTLWVVDANAAFNDSIHQIDPTDGSILISFIPQGDPLSLMFGLAWDGKYLWVTDIDDDQIHKIELGLHVSIWVTGVCPGPTQLTIEGETPSGSYALLRGTGTGFTTVPAGVCEGSAIGLTDPSLVRVDTADADGNYTVSGEIGAGLCGAYVQILDLETCLPSAVARLPR